MTTISSLSWLIQLRPRERFNVKFFLKLYNLRVSMKRGKNPKSLTWLSRALRISDDVDLQSPSDSEIFIPLWHYVRNTNIQKELEIKNVSGFWLYPPLFTLLWSFSTKISGRTLDSCTSCYLYRDHWYIWKHEVNLISSTYVWPKCQVRYFELL